uniref:Ig-like domain-containing protein n=1 Tax=Acrobeloides nanus TaxID=290746 RepID=A0A914BWB4_9BILA
MEEEKSAQLTTNVSAQVGNLLKSALTGPIDPNVAAQVNQGINDLIGITASAIDLGSTIITQIRIVGSLADNAERPNETADACMLIEKVMLRMSKNWEEFEGVWSPNKDKFSGYAPAQIAQAQALGAQAAPDRAREGKEVAGKYAAQLAAFENWLQAAQAKFGQSQDSSTINILLQESKQQRENFKQLIQEIEKDPSYGQLSGRITDIQNNIENFIKQLEDRHQLFARTQQFFQNADSMLHQLSAMSADLINANASMAGELGPLARQKAMVVIEEGEKILRYGHNQPVIDKLNQLHSKLSEVEQLAQQRIQAATQHLRQQISTISTWLKDVAEPFLASSGNMGNDLASAAEFLNRHKSFATEVINKEHEVHAILNRAHELPEEDRRSLRDFQQRYENVKQALEWRIQLGNTYQQVQKFARELEGSFDSLSQLLSSNQNFANEQVANQMVNVFHMIQETLSQERHQGEKFVSNAKAVGTQDLHLNVDQAIDSVRSILVEHENRFSQLTHKWQDWQKSKGEAKRSLQVLEEIHIWQIDTSERIRTLEQQAEHAQTVQEREQIQAQLQRISHEIPAQTQKIQEVERIATEQRSQEVLQKIPEVKHRQEEIKTRVGLIQEKLQVQQQIQENIRKTIEEIQIWQVETFDRIRQIEDQARNARTQQESEQVQTQLQRIVQEIPPQGQRIQEVEKVVREQRQGEEVARKVVETQRRQQQLEDTVQQVQQRVQVQQAAQEIRNTIEEIQIWQVDTYERIRQLEDQASRARDQQEYEQVQTQIQKVVQEIPPQRQRIQEIQKVVQEQRQGEDIVRQVAETQRRQQQLEEAVQQAQQRVQVQRAAQEIRKTIEEIQIWQVDTFERIRQLEDQASSVRTQQEQEQVQTQIQKVVQEIPPQRQRIQEIQKVVQEQRQGEDIARQVAETQRRQQQLEEAVQQAQQQVQQQVQVQRAAQEIRKTIEEIQIWQVDTFERIRQLEDQASSVRTQQEQEQVQTQIQKVVQEIPPQRQRIQEIQKVVQEQRQGEDVARQVAETQRRQQQLEETIQQVQQKVQGQQETQTLRKTIEEIQIWQVDTFERIRVLEDQANRSRTQQEYEQVQTQIQKVVQEIPPQRQKIQEVQQIVQQQRQGEEILRPLAEIQKRQQQLEESLQQAQRKVQAKKEVEEKIQRTVEEIQMWQVDTIGRIRLREAEAEKVQTIEEREEVKEKVEKTLQELPVQQHKLQEVVRTVREQGAEEAVRKVAEVQSQQQEVETRLEKLYQKVLSPPGQPKETIKRVVEEIQMWQEDVFEIIRVLDAEAERAKTIQEKEVVREKLERTIQQVPQQQIRLQEAQQRVLREQESEETVRKLVESQRRQQELEERLRQLQKKVTETFITEQLTETQRAPRLVTELRDVQVEEGTRFEFAAKIDAAPEPRVTWLKDGIDVKDNADYRTVYLNGTATLTIEETFIEDTAVYTLRAENGLGKAESSAKLIVKSRSQLGKEEAQKPRFVKQLQNVTITEGETARLDCVVVAQPEPKVVWYKEEETIRESDRVKLQFSGDHCILTLHDTRAQDQGLYKVRAQNIHGETTNFCRLTVQPRRVAPPKPAIRVEAPAFTPSLTNQTVREGQQAVLQVRTTGEPEPKVTWKFQDRPIQTSETTQLIFESNGWSRVVIERAQPQHSGLYMVEAINEAGEARTGATLVVAPGYEVPKSIQTQDLTQEVVRRQIQQEGFWSDGAYTAGTPTPPPIPRHYQTTTEEFAEHEVSDLGYSSIANAPEFIRPFQNEYTVNEGEKIQIDCEMIGNPRPKIHWFFNDRPIKSNYQFAEFINIGDTYSINFNPAKLENAGFYRMVAENVRGKTESATLIHVRPKSLIPQPAVKPKKPHTIEHQKVYEEFGATEYREIIPAAHKHQRSGVTTPPPAKKPHPEALPRQMGGSLYHQRQDEFLDQYDAQEKQVVGHPPHFTQTLVSCVATVGDSAKFEGVVTGWPAPDVQWTKDGINISKQSHPHIDFSNIGGRVSLTFHNASLDDAGKYMCTAKNSSGVATSSAQFVVRPKTIAPDFVKRLISEEVMEGERLKWTVRVTGDPPPKVTWLRDGQVIPDCEEVRLVNEGNGAHSMIIQHVELADCGQFTCLAENTAGEARSTADLVVRPQGTEPGSYFHITKVTQEKQVKGEEVSRNQTFSIENPRITTPINP